LSLCASFALTTISRIGVILVPRASTREHFEIDFAGHTVRNGRDDAAVDAFERPQSSTSESTTHASRATDYPASPGWRESTTSRETAERCALRGRDRRAWSR
jgi:hypothetical protein